MMHHWSCIKRWNIFFHCGGFALFNVPIFTETHKWVKIYFTIILKERLARRTLCQCACSAAERGKNEARHLLWWTAGWGNVHSMVRAAGRYSSKLQNHGDVLLFAGFQLLCLGYLQALLGFLCSLFSELLTNLSLQCKSTVWFSTDKTSRV